MQKLFEKVFRIRPEEHRRVQAFFLHYTCIGMLYTFGASTGDSLFLSHVSGDKVQALLAWIYVGIAVATVAATWVFDRLQGRFRRVTLIAGTELLLAATVVGFRLLLPGDGQSAPGWIYFALVVWLEVCALLSIVLFFSFVGDYFTARDAKRVFGYMAGGLCLGNFLAGGAVTLLVEVVGTANLLYLVAGLLVACAGVAFYVNRTILPLYRGDEAGDGQGGETLAPVVAILRHRYIRLIFLVSLLGLACFVLVDYQMKIVARESFTGAESLAAFFGRFYTVVGLSQLAFQFLLVGLLLRRLGIITCLMILPTLHLIMAGFFYATGHGLFVGHALFIIAAANFTRMTITETLEMPSRELALLPLASRLRLRAQAMMGGMLAPIGQGVGGLLIVVLGAAGLQLYQLSIAVLGAAGLWLVALVLARPRYRQTLSDSLRNAQLDAAEIRAIVQDESSEHVLDMLLRSPEPEVVVFTLGLLRDRPLGGLASRVAALAESDRPEIAEWAIDLLGESRDAAHLGTLERILSSESRRVRGAAARAQCRILGERASVERASWLEHDDDVVRHSAIVGIGRDGGPAGLDLVLPVLEGMGESDDPADRARVCELLAGQQHAAGAALLEVLLRDDDPSVRIAAVAATGALRLAELSPTLLSLASDASLRPVVLDALGRMPDDAADSISAVAGRADLDEELRVQLFHVLAEVEGMAAHQALWRFFQRAPEITTRVSAGRALQRRALGGRAAPVADEQYDECLEGLCRKLALLNRVCREVGAEHADVIDLVRDHQWLETERLFQLLSLRHDPRVLATVRYNLDSPLEVLRSNSLELLGDVLPRRISQEVVPVIEPLVEGKCEPGPGISLETAEELRQLEPWLRVLTLASLTGETLSSEMSVDLLHAEDLAYELVREPVADLKKVPLFAGVPADSLIPLARTARTLRLRPEETLFEQGDPGGVMYLVKEGAIGVLVDDVEVARIGAGEVLGEMAVIEGEPRSATCVAREATELVEIAAEDFESLVRGHGSAALAVVRTLSARLRRRNEAVSARATSESEEIAPCEESARDGECLEPPVGGGELTELIERYAFLRQVEIFDGLKGDDLSAIAELATTVSLFAGEALFEQGDHADSMYVIRAGSISVQVGGHEVTRLGSRDPIGEMALVDGQPRSASCVVVDDAVLIRIAAEDFNLLLSVQPDIAMGLMRSLSARLRKAG